MIALVPTLNEADTIGPLVSALREVCERVMVVDDPRSTDGTERVAHAFGAETLVDTDAYGIGPALLAGMEYLWAEARRSGPNMSRVAVIDAGGSHDPLDLPLMAYYTADVVIGSRFVPGAHYTGRPARSVASRAYTKVCNRRTGQEISDWTSGCRIYSPRAVGAILAARPRQKMHAWQPAALAACVRAGCTVAEQPIRYLAGRSSMNRRHAWEAVKTLGAIR